jgi:hypothetical protein
VQIENTPESRPRSGLQRADFVYEYLTEGGITRFTAVYLQPAGPSRIEPVRSTRLVTLRLRQSYGGVIFHSGASNHVIDLVYSHNLPFVDENRDGGRYFSRDRSRPAPHNLFTTQDQLLQGLHAANLHVSYPPLPRAEPALPGEVANHLSFEQTPFHHVDYAYSAPERAYLYGDNYGPEVDTDTGGAQIRVTNVVLVQVPHHGAGYTEDVLGAEGIDFNLAGSGPADVFTRGSHYAATWDLSNPDRPLRILTPEGRAMSLPPGLTWIHLVDPGMPKAFS